MAERPVITQLEALTEWVKSNPPEVVAARLKELDDALGQMLDAERDNELGAVLGYCSHGVNLDQAFCPDGCRV